MSAYDDYIATLPRRFVTADEFDRACRDAGWEPATIRLMRLCGPARFPVKVGAEVLRITLPVPGANRLRELVNQ